jgi:hypothetical protein
MMGKAQIFLNKSITENKKHIGQHHRPLLIAFRVNALRK